MTNVVPLSPGNQPDRPADVETEAAYLGAVLGDNDLDAIAGAAIGLTPEHFVEPIHQRIYSRIREHIQHSRPATPVTLRQYFDDDESLRDLGGAKYLAQLSGSVVARLAPKGYAEEILRAARPRAFADALARAQVECRHPDADIAAITETITQAGRLAAPSIGPFPSLDLTALAGTEPRAKVFTLPRIAPAGEVTLFTGPGAVGKSLLGQQLATGLAAGRRTIGLDLAKAPAIYLTCEDDAEQLHWRQVHICRTLGVEIAALAGNLTLISRRGELDNALANFSPDGRLSPTPTFHRLVALIKATGAQLACLDNVAHLFAGNENDRGHVTQFINLLNGAAGETGAAILLLAHPNKAGDSYSGSTAWLNAVRSQVFMSLDDGDDADPDVRTLTIGKPNYTQRGQAMLFRWRDWAFVEDDPFLTNQPTDDDLARAGGENAAFMRCLAKKTEERVNVSHSSAAANYAPKVFEQMLQAKGIRMKGFEAAMQRLLDLGQIRANERVFQYPNRTWAKGLAAVDEGAQRFAQSPHKAPAQGRTKPDPESPETVHEGCTKVHNTVCPLPTEGGGGPFEGPPPPQSSDEEALS